MKLRAKLKIHLSLVGFLPLIGLLSAGPALAQEQADILITGGTVYDGGTGKPFVGDVVVKGDKIVYVGPKANVSARRTINAKGMVVSPGFIDGHVHPQHWIDSPDAQMRQAPPDIMQGVSTLIIGVDGGGTPDLNNLFGRYRQMGIGPNVASYVGYGTIRKRVIGEDGRAPTPAELATEKSLVVKGMCEGAIGFSTGLFYAPQNFAKTDEIIVLAREAATRGGIYDTHRRDESDYTVGVMNATREALEIGRQARIPVHISHIKALGMDVWGKSADMIKMINAARAAGQNVTANQYPWLASHTGLDAALVPRWVEDGGYAAMIKRFNDPTLMPKIKKEMTDNLRRRNGPHAILFSDPGQPWSGKYLDEVAKDWKIDPVDAAIRILRQSEHQSIVSFNMSQADVDNFMKQPWVVTSSDGGTGHPRATSSFSLKYADYVEKRHVIPMVDFIHRSTGMSARIFQLDRRGFLKSGYYADIVVFNPATYAPHADYVHWDRLSTGVVNFLINGKLAVDNGKMTDVLSGRPLLHTPPQGTCR